MSLQSSERRSGDFWSSSAATTSGSKTSPIQPSRTTRGSGFAAGAPHRLAANIKLLWSPPHPVAARGVSANAHEHKKTARQRQAHCVRLVHRLCMMHVSQACAGMKGVCGWHSFHFPAEMLQYCSYQYFRLRFFPFSMCCSTTIVRCSLRKNTTTNCSIVAAI